MMSFNPDLTLNAVVVNLIATTDGRVPLTQGALAHAAFFDLVAAADPDLAARLHDSGARQPFTISPLRELPEQADADGYRLRAGARAALRLTLLDPDLFVVILVKVNLQTQAWAHVILFSSDLKLAYDTLIDYYRLRFQIEFRLRRPGRQTVLGPGRLHERLGNRCDQCR
jgi:hypothetical protein